MVQDQLVEYINSQLKAGVSVDAVRSALVGAGWQAADVDDTMKKVQGAGTSSVAAQPSVQAKPAASAASPAASSASGPQVIRVSDLVSSSSPAIGSSVVSAGSMSGAKTDSVISKINAGTSKMAPAGSSVSGGASPIGSMKVKSSRGSMMMWVLGALVVICAAAAAFFFFESQGLSSQVASLNAQSGGVNSQLSQLQQQLDATTTALEGQVAASQATNDLLSLELSFLVVKPGTAITSTFTSALRGTVSGGGAKAYTIMTPDGVRVTVSNSKDSRVAALLGPLATQTSTVTQFSGNYTPGVASISITAVGGQSVTAPAATSTASTTTGTTNAPMIPATGTAQ